MTTSHFEFVLELKVRALADAREIEAVRAEMSTLQMAVHRLLDALGYMADGRATIQTRRELVVEGQTTA